MSVVPTYIQDPPSHGSPPQKEHLPDQLVHSVCIIIDRWWDVCGLYTCLGSPVTWNSTAVGTSTWPAGSFCVCCLWQAVRCLWSLHVSGIPCHTALQPSRNVYLTSWFILSVLFLTGSETSVVPTCVRVPHHTDLHPLCVSGIPSHTDLHPGKNVYLTSWYIFLCCFWQVVRCLWSLHVSMISSHTDLHPSRNVCLTSWFILFVLFLTDGEMSVVPTSFRDPPSHGPPPW